MTSMLICPVIILTCWPERQWVRQKRDMIQIDYEAMPIAAKAKHR
jgi:hypothetical protein